MTSGLEWQFGGWLRLLPAPLAWGIWAAVAAGALVFVVRQYRSTLRALTPRARIALTALRAAIGLAVLLCLANPSWVDRPPRDQRGHDTLAVVVDRSDSMGSADYRGMTRLANAVRLWKQHEAEANAAFPHTVYRQFALASDAAPSLDAAVDAKEPGTETHLFDAIRQTFTLAPAAIVCLTDGLDTTTANPEALAAEAQTRGVPLYFVVGANRTRSGELTDIREIKAPSQVLRRTQFTASALIEIASARAQETSVELWSGETQLATKRLPVRVGLNTLSWPVQVTAREAGPMPLEFRVGAGDKQQVTACTTQVVDHTKLEVLYYQGALQWGYHYLLAALESDPSFHMTSILNPALGVRVGAGSEAHNILPDLPDDARDLKRFQIVVLAHVFADRLSDRQQRALVEYARGGGGVLFIAPDNAATQRFAGTELEQMLPVAFDAVPAATPVVDDRARRFQEQMAVADPGADGLADGSDGRRQTLPRLTPFTLPPGASATGPTALLRNIPAVGMPKFCEYAKVRSVKPGADILAVKAGGGGAPGVLLARQQFGAGFAAALTTDLLWRWKMSLRSDSHAAETFWQQLLLSLAPPPGSGLRLVKLSQSPSIRSSVSIRVEGAATAGAAPSVEVVSPAGQRLPLILHASSESGVWTTGFDPDAEGRWEVRAADAAHNLARIAFPVNAKAHTAENLDLPPDIDGMRRLAQSTGGALIEEQPVFQAAPAPAAEGQPSRRARPLWHSGWLLGLMLGLYGTELVTRRWLRLL